MLLYFIAPWFCSGAHLQKSSDKQMSTAHACDCSVRDIAQMSLLNYLLFCSFRGSSPLAEFCCSVLGVCFSQAVFCFVRCRRACSHCRFSVSVSFAARVRQHKICFCRVRCHRSLFVQAVLFGERSMFANAGRRTGTVCFVPGQKIACYCSLFARGCSGTALV
jgi:hypothetical protein